MKNFYKNFLVLIAASIMAGNINAQTQLVTDGSFEAGAGSGNWVEASTTFGTPICEIVACGSGSGTGPHSGTHFAWFGGVTGNIETASVSQAIVIPAGGTVTLTFWLEQILCDSPQDFIQVTVDGNEVFASDGGSPLCGVLGYSLQTVDISAYADGNSHVLEFNATTFSANGDLTNFFVDDISVISSTGGPGVSACSDTTAFTGLNVAIPDSSINGVINSQTISGVTGTLGLDVKLKSVCFKIDHTWVGDLTVILIAPNGTEITLTDRVGVPLTANGCDGDNLEVCVDLGTGNEMEPYCSNLPAISGSFTAANGTNLDDINNAGGPANGTWQLFLSDSEADDTGSLIEWSLTFDDGPVANWTSPGTVCATAGTINLVPLVTGTAGGTWSGTGVTGNSFDPAGLSGVYDITYTVSDTLAGCFDSEVNPITVVPGAPVAGFSFTTISLTGIFYNSSSDGTGYLWNFGDATTSTLENPVHTYAANGTYTVTLTVTNSCGSSVSTQTVTVVNCPDIITDGSFESGPGAGTWTETSTNFTTPVCDTVNCDPGNGTGPRTGTYWAWFGGVAQFEESSVSQDITIAVNSNAILYFWMELPQCDGPADFLKIAIDADTVYAIDGSNNLCGTTGYSLQSVNLSAYDDGLPHTLKFYSKVYGLNGNVTNFFIDDISLIVCTGIGFAENILEQQVTVMPVPAHESISVFFNDITASDVKIAITDLPGKNIWNTSIEQLNGTHSEKINVSDWSKGVYLMKITSGNNSVIRKIVIQ